MEIVSPIVGMVSGLCNYIAAKLSHLNNLDRRVDSLGYALKELINQKKDLERLADKAELEGSACTNQVNGWMERVASVEAKAEACSITEDAIRRRRCFWCCYANCPKTYMLSKEVAELLSEITELIGKGPVEVVADGRFPAAVEEVPSRPAIGIDVMLQKVWQILADDESGMVGVYGMGGVGKTTLLKTINNECLTKSHHFEVVIWVVVSKEFVAYKIQHAVGARLGLSWDDSETEDQRAKKIYRVMKKKRFLLLLDDVWGEIDLQKIGIPLPDKNNKCKVIFTTRSLDVCSDMDAQQKLKMEFLGEEDSWELFCNKAGGTDILESLSIQPHAKTIVRKCGGLPLALITIARAMANEESEEEWKDAIEKLNRDPSELRGMKNVFNLLKFSYDNLDNDTLRSCLLYCSLFPEDYSIEKEQLIDYWIGEGFLNSSLESYVYNQGHAIIGSLKVACLLETGEERNQVKMHDVVRSFALWIASDCGANKMQFLVEASMGLDQAPRAEAWKGAKRVSLLDNGITSLTETPECPNLSTLLLQWNSGLNKIFDGFFQFMPALRVLDLSFTSLREIPTSINQLVELQHLDLSATKIAALPKELGDLTNLKHLELQRTHCLQMIPRDAISGLMQLRVLNIYYSYGGWEDCKSDICDEVDLEDLHSLKYLNTLGITVNEFETLKKLYSLRSLLKSIQYLYIKECEGLHHFWLTPNANFGERLRRISINNCYDLEYLEVSKEAGANWLPSLEVLALHGLPNLETVWKNPVTEHCLKNLCCVNIWHCHKLKNLSWSFQLPKLEVIYLMYCDEIEEVVSKDVMSVGDAKAFPSLRTLSIRDLPKLRSITRQVLAFPSLESIAVIDCPNLKKLMIKSQQNTSASPTVYGSKEWWDGLEWDESISECSVLPHFISI